MFYKLRKKVAARKFDRQISAILDTPPIQVKDAPWCVVSMIAKSDLAMYLLAIKSFYRKLGRGKIAAIIDRDTPQATRDVLAQHVAGIEFAVLEDISTGACQRGGTWERLLYCLDRSQHEYTIQLDADTLTVGNDIDEIVRCAETNTPFTMSDGFSILPLPNVAREAQVSSDYIGLVSERKFAQYPHAQGWRYVRGSSGLAGFSRGGFSREKITRFHQIMEELVSASRWREWGTEQSGSNFAIANSPEAVILPFPEYQSFLPNSFRQGAKFFHFIGSFRMRDNYFAARGQRIIAELRTGYRPHLKVIDPDPYLTTRFMAFARMLTPVSAVKYFAWRAISQQMKVWVQKKNGLQIQLRPRSSGNNDYGVAYEIFVHQFLLPRVWIPRVRVALIVDFGANVGFSCSYWLANYHLAKIIAFEPNPKHVSQFRVNIARNAYDERVTLHEAAAGVAEGQGWISDAASSQMSKTEDCGFKVRVMDVFKELAGREIDILKIDIEGGEYEILADPRFASLDVKAIVLEWHARPDIPNGDKWCRDRLQKFGYRLYPIFQHKSYGMFWAYRTTDGALNNSLRWRRAEPRKLV